MQGRVAGLASALAAAAAAAAGRSRVLDARLLAHLRSLTADAALAEQQQEHQEQHERRRVDANDDNAPLDNDSSSRARRLREMEASTSARSSRHRGWLPSAAEVSARLRGSSGGKKGGFKSTAAAAAVIDGVDSNEDKSESDVDEKSRPKSPLRDWRDALEAAKELKTGHDPLTDTFGRRHTYLRISLTERCNLRCTYCMPAEGVDGLTPKQDLLSTSEVLRLARLFATLGVEKVRLTGGEPTLRGDLLEIASAISSTPGIDTLGLTTNGVALGIGNDPSVVASRVAALAASGITSLNVSLDTLRPERFEKLSRRPAAGHAAALAAIDAAAGSRLFRDQVKVNVVVMRGVNDDEVGAFSSWAASRGGAVNVRFIEFMPFEANEWETRKVVSYKEMLSRAREGLSEKKGRGGESVDLVPFFDDDDGGKQKRHRRRRWHYDGVAKDFALSTPSTNSSPVVSFITSMTSPFCSSCTRLRLLADGNLKVCLLGGAEVSLRDAMRGGCSDSDLSLLVRGALANKKAAHAGMKELGKKDGRVGAGRAMVRIGG